MSAEHHLAGPCEGIVIYRDGTTVTVKDAQQREDLIMACSSDASACAAVWTIRDHIYAKYDNHAAQISARGGILHG